MSRVAANARRRAPRHGAAARLPPARPRRRRRSGRVPRRADGETPYPVEYQARQAQAASRRRGAALRAGALPGGDDRAAGARRRAVLRRDEAPRRRCPSTPSCARLTESDGGDGLRTSFAAGRTPPADYRADRCRACSLIDLCRPKAGRRRSPRSAASRHGRGGARARSGDAVKKLLNTLYVTTEGASLRKDGENLVAEVDGAERARVPLHMLGSVVVFGAHLRVAAADPGLRRGRHHDRAARSRRPLSGAHRRASQRQRAAAARAISRLRQARRDRPQHRLGQDRQPAQRCCSGPCATMARSWRADRASAPSRRRSTGWRASCAASPSATTEPTRCAAPRARRPTSISPSSTT